MACDPDNTITSLDIEGLKSDIETIDEVVESTEDTVLSKNNQSIYTLRGQLKRLGYLVPINYVGGISFGVNDSAKTIDESGVIYAPIVDELPFTTSGTWIGDDEDKFYVVQSSRDAAGIDLTVNGLDRDSLQSYLENKEVPDYATLRTLPSDQLADGDKIWVEGFPDSWEVKTGTVTDCGHYLVFTDDSNRYAETTSKDAWLEIAGVLITNTAVQNTAAYSVFKSAYLDGNSGVLRSRGGTFLFNDTVVIPGQNWSLDLNNAVLSLDGATGTISNQSAITITGEGLTQIENLSSDISAGEKTISMASVPSVSAGDVILLHDPTDNSYTGFRAQNQIGEFRVVQSVSGSEITVDDLVRFSYTAGQTNVYKVDLADGYWKNFKGIGPGGSSSTNDNSAVDVAFRFCRGAVDNVKSTGSDNQSMVFDMCFELHGTNLDVKQLTDINNYNTNYGHRFNSSDRCTAQGNFTGYRHGTDCGPISGAAGVGVTKVCINCTWLDSSIVGNLSGAGINAANTHGAQEGCGYQNCHVYGGGVGYSGNQSFFIGGSINVPSSASNSPLYTPFELSGFDHVLGSADTVYNYYANSNAGSGRQMIDIGDQVSAVLDANTLHGGVTFIRGQVNAPNATGDFVRAENRGFTGDPLAIVFDDLKFNAPNINELIDFDSSSGGGDDFEYVDIRDVYPGSGLTVWVSGAGSVTTKIRGLSVSGTVTITPDTGQSTATEVIVLPIAFGRTPNIQLTGDALNAGGDRYYPYYASATSSGFNANVATVDGGNFSNTTPVDISWTATLNEY